MLQFMKKVFILKNHKSFLNLFWKLLVFGLIAFFISSQLSDQKWHDFSFEFIDPIIVSLVLVLMAIPNSLLLDQ